MAKPPSPEEVQAMMAKFLPSAPTHNLPATTRRYVPKLVEPQGWSPTLTKEQQERIDHFLSKQSGASLDTTALVCKGHDCDYRSHCPLYQMDPALVPLEKPCAIELSLAELWVEEYKHTLEIEDDDVVDLAILKQYVSWQLFMRRATQEMAQDPKILRREFAGVDTTGNVLMKESMNPIFLMMEKGSKRMQKLMESLLATREAKARSDGGKQQTMSAFLAALTDRVQEKTRKKKKLRKTRAKVIDTKAISSNPPMKD